VSSLPEPGPPGEVPRRRLERAPSDRYRATEAGEAAASRPSRPSRPWLPDGGLAGGGFAFAIVIGAVGALVFVIVYGVLALTTGLLAIAGATGYLAGIAFRGSPAQRPWGLVIAAASMALGLLGGWLMSLVQGGVAGPSDYIAETLGGLAIVILLVAAAGAWLGSR
jgi:hypothetical protein